MLNTTRWSPVRALYKASKVSGTKRDRRARPFFFFLNFFYFFCLQPSTFHFSLTHCLGNIRCTANCLDSRPRSYHETPPQHSAGILQFQSPTFHFFQFLKSTFLFTMNSTSVHFSPVKDGRRILGEKDSNACLSPATHVKSLPAVGTPVKRASIATSPKKLLPSPIFAGQKRTRDQVDETEEILGHVQTRESSLPPAVQSTLNDDMQSQVSSCKTDKKKSMEAWNKPRLT